MLRHEVIDLIERMESVYYRNPRSADAISKAAGEWERTLRFCSVQRINEALTQYMSEKHRYAPTPGQLLAIYNDIGREKEARQQKVAVSSGLACRFCNRSIDSTKRKFALVAAVDGDFWGVYPALGMPCPCTRAGEMAALKRGQHVHRKVGKRRGDGVQVYIGEVELWVDECGRLVGRAARGFKTEGDADVKAESAVGNPPNAEQPQSRQNNLFSPEEWAAEMDMPPF